MNKRMSLLTIIVMLGNCISSFASSSIFDFEVDGIYYKITSDVNQKVEVTYKSVMKPEGGDYQKSEVVIPENVSYDGKTYSVTSIGRYAFQGCSNLISVVIPNTVTSIERMAFESCTKLSNVNIPNSVNSIKEFAFSGTKLTNVVIPNSVTSIGESAFEYCDNLVQITLPSSLKKIGVNAFHSTAWWNNQPYGLIYLDNYLIGCNSNIAEDIEIKDGTVLIGDKVFCNNKELVSVNIPYSVKIIGAEAFASCTKLTVFDIPNSVEVIGDRAFSSCTNLTSFNIPNSVINIGIAAFQNTAWWNEQQDGLIYLDNCLLGYKSTIAREIVVKENTRVIGARAFYDCSNITSITIPHSVTNIGDNVFEFCLGLTQIVSNAEIPPTVEESAFLGCIIPNIVLKVPKGSLNAYQSVSGWSAFEKMEEFDPASIGVIIPNTGNSSAPIYNLQGVQMKEAKENLPAGIYIQGGKKIIIR